MAASALGAESSRTDQEITIGRLLNAYLRSLPDDDLTHEAALPPISDCTPNQLQDSMTLLLKSHPTPLDPARWATHLLTEMAPLLDWNMVLAHARFPKPTSASPAG